MTDHDTTTAAVLTEAEVEKLWRRMQAVNEDHSDVAWVLTWAQDIIASHRAQAATIAALTAENQRMQTLTGVLALADKAQAEAVESIIEHNTHMATTIVELRTVLAGLLDVSERCRLRPYRGGDASLQPEDWQPWLDRARLALRDAIGGGE